MRTIHKYLLDDDVVTDVETHLGVRWLAAQMQGDRMTVWAEVNTDRRTVTARLHVVGTGQAIPAPATHYIGTVQRGTLPWVFHIYAEALDE